MPSIIIPCIISTLSLLFLLILSAQASTPSVKTFTFVNEGLILNFHHGEYGSNIRTVEGIDGPLALGLYFYNNTPNAFTFAIGMGFYYNLRWVWAANRAKPVREGATLSLGKDGNLVLADVDHEIVWQTGTANKGVIGLKLLENGNLVLYDAKERFIWQSFDHPTDTLLQTQSLRVGVADKLVSRVHTTSSLEGPYSLMIRPNRLSMYYKSRNSPHLLQYHTILKQSSLKNVTYYMEKTSAASYLKLDPYFYLTTMYYNSTYSFLRLDYDGNLRVYAFTDETALYPYEMDFVGRWEVVYTMFTKGSEDDGELVQHETKCQIPEYCGKFGLCNKDHCIACPSPNGLLGWSEKCEPPKLGACSGGKNAKYYKMEGVEHFTSKNTKGEGPMKQTECQKKCSFDCKCVGFFYRQETARCWIAYDLKTLTKSENNKHLGYIKTAN